MQRLLIWILIPLLLVGCATGNQPSLIEQDVTTRFIRSADIVKFPRGEAFKTFNKISVAFAKLEVRADVACKAGRLDAGWCNGERLRLIEEAQKINDRVLDALANPAVEVDWKAIGEALEVMMKIAGAFI